MVVLTWLLQLSGGQQIGNRDLPLASQKAAILQPEVLDLVQCALHLAECGADDLIVARFAARRARFQILENEIVRTCFAGVDVLPFQVLVDVATLPQIARIPMVGHSVGMAADQIAEYRNRFGEAVFVVGLSVNDGRHLFESVDVCAKMLGTMDAYGGKREEEIVK